MGGLARLLRTVPHSLGSSLRFPLTSLHRGGMGPIKYAQVLRAFMVDTPRHVYLNCYWRSGKDTPVLMHLSRYIRSET